MRGEATQFMENNRHIFIGILDKQLSEATHFSGNFDFYPLKKDKRIISALVRYNSNYYIKSEPEHLNHFSHTINSNGRVFSIYGETESIDRLEELIYFPIRSRVNYHLMLLKKSDFTPLVSSPPGVYCLRCSRNNFRELKRLQYEYHLEEVYTDSSYYPYEMEMRNFKKMLSSRINMAVFSQFDNSALSKAYVNAEYGNSCQIGGVYTRRDWRKRGLSSFCLNELFKELFKEKMDSIYLFVNRTNRAAINLYLKLGFKTISYTSTLYF